ncbi:bifunctional diguanylate cyclase/phosphodiesterase [Sphingomonas parva]|uniref:Bifunctional diguanylate cyclase/phosphodiesterase n=1 Tax=Sphingomonas parva TaxID=2555898 RepID=A0A4Y8ZTH6_9SPHN|nr:bifunctional diguanylate cyclase/phosphodiesterase [Sphingomonas parva]TFI58069.1 bifunctional diguanylate cyclase/phosphodiesterase [Sphingomonas parva]
MEAAAAPARTCDDADAGELPEASHDARMSTSVRQDYIDALPIAAAVFRLGDGAPLWIDIANEPFVDLAGWDLLAGPREASESAFLDDSGLGDAIAQFLKTNECTRQFESSDGQLVGARHFVVRLARLRAYPGLGVRCLVSLIDRTAQVETERSLRAEMLRDSLTGLPNRLAFNEEVEKVLEDPAFLPGSHAVLVVDMTRFSRVNECVGSMAGDELLITFARRLFSSLRAGDFLARTGGDEFGLLLKLDKGLEDAIQAAERIRTALSAPFRLSELEIRVDCAMGCALLGGSEELAEEVLRNAQFALKRAKVDGGIRFYEPNQARAARRRFSIETELRRAIEGNELTLAFQPLVDLKTGAVSGFEALARWENGRRGAISPVEFIPVAEESGLIVPLGRWALEAAVETLASWDRKAGRTLPLSVSVNLSAIQIARDDVATRVSAALEAHGIGGDRLTLELTESAIVQDPRRATKVLQELKDLRARVAMDDFGTGYTSLAYLQRLPIDVLKIDQSFVAAMLGDGDSIAIVRAILSLADALGMDTTAEGIDSPELAKALTRLGCTHGQGFYFARPLPGDAALDYWLARSA